jgi:hypothetical protein
LHEGCQPDREEYQRDFPIAVPELASAGGLDAGEGEGFVIVQVINDFDVAARRSELSETLRVARMTALKTSTMVRRFM